MEPMQELLKDEKINMMTNDALYSFLSGLFQIFDTDSKTNVILRNNRENIMIDKIIIRGAKVHNLKNIDVDVPLHKIVGIAAYPVPVSLRWPWACSMPRAPDDTWMLCPPTRDGE